MNFHFLQGTRARECCVLLSLCGGSRKEKERKGVDERERERERESSRGTTPLPPPPPPRGRRRLLFRFLCSLPRLWLLLALYAAVRAHSHINEHRGAMNECISFNFRTLLEKGTEAILAFPSFFRGDCGQTVQQSSKFSDRIVLLGLLLLERRERGERTEVVGRRRRQRERIERRRWRMRKKTPSTLSSSPPSSAAALCLFLTP